MNAIVKRLKEYFKNLKNCLKKHWLICLFSLGCCSPYLLLNSQLAEKFICFGLGYCLKAEKVEFLEENSGIILHKIHFENETAGVKSAKIFFQWKFQWNYDKLEIGECLIEGAEILLKDSTNNALEDKKNVKLPAWMRWLPAIHIKKIALNDITVTASQHSFKVSAFELEELKLLITPQDAHAPLPFAFRLIPKSYLNDAFKDAEMDVILSALFELQHYLDVAYNYQKMLKISCARVHADARQFQANNLINICGFDLKNFDMTPHHWHCQKVEVQLNDYFLTGQGDIIFDDLNPFQFQCQLFHNNRNNESLLEEISSVIIQGNDQLNTGFKIGGLIKKELFQNSFSKHSNFLISDIQFCFKSIAAETIHFQASTKNAQTHPQLYFDCTGHRDNDAPWNFEGALKSQDPFELSLKWLPYRAVQNSFVVIHPQMQFGYIAPLKDDSKALGKFTFLGDFSFVGGNIDLNIMNFSKNLPLKIEEEVILNSRPLPEELDNDLKAPDKQQRRDNKKWQLPEIFFDNVTVTIAPEVKIFCNGLNAFLEGTLNFNHALNDLDVQGHILGKPLTDNAPINTIPIKLKEATLKADGQGIDHINLELWFEALPNARGKQLPFETFLIALSSSSFKVLARQRGSISFMNLFYLNWNDSQLPMSNPSENLLPFLSIVVLGSLGDFIRAIVPLERAEKVLEDLLSQIMPRPNVQLIQPCMKELNQLLLQLVIVDWDNWINFWMGVNFPLSGMLQEKNVFSDGSKNQLQMVLDIFFNTRLSLALEMLPSLKASFSFKCDWNELFNAQEESN